MSGLPDQTPASAVLLVLVMLPFWTSSLLRIYALIGLLNPNGFINTMLLPWRHDAPLQHDADRFFHLYGYAADLSAADDPAALCHDDPP